MNRDDLHHRRWAIFAAAAVVFAAGILVLDVLPRTVRLGGLSLAWYENRRSLHDADALEARLVEMRDARSMLEAELAAIADHSCESCTAHVFGQIRGLLEHESIRLTEIRPGTPSETETAVITPVELVARGSYHAFGRFVDAAEQLDEILALRKLEMTARESDGLLEAHLHFEIIALRDRS